MLVLLTRAINRIVWLYIIPYVMYIHWLKVNEYTWCMVYVVNNVPRNCWAFWKQLISSNFQNGILEINYHNRDENGSHPSLLFTVLLNKKNNENMEYHGTFTPFKNHLYSKPIGPIFSVVWVMQLRIMSLCLGKAKVLPTILAGQS